MAISDVAFLFKLEYSLGRTTVLQQQVLHEASSRAYSANQVVPSSDPETPDTLNHHHATPIPKRNSNEILRRYLRFSDLFNIEKYVKVGFKCNFLSSRGQKSIGQDVNCRKIEIEQTRLFCLPSWFFIFYGVSHQRYVVNI